jgi:hypothetical protein
MDLKQNVTLSSLGVLLLWWISRGVVAAIGYGLAGAFKQWALLPITVIAGHFIIRAMIGKLDRAQLERHAARQFVKSLERP